MRIAHVTSTFPPYHAGIGNVCYYNARELSRLGHEVTVFTAAHPPGEYTYRERFVVRRLPPLFRVGNAAFLPDLLGIDGYDIAHLHWPFPFGAEMVWTVSKMRKIPYVVTHHNDLIGDGLRRYLFDGYSALSGRLVFGGASKFIAVSLDHAASCRMTPLFRRRWADVVEILNGVDTNLFHPGLDSTPVRRQYGIRDEARVILFVGVLDRAHHFKGAGHLLRAFSRMEDERAILILVGEGDLKERHMALARALGVAERTRFVGAVPHERLPLLYAVADVVVLPSFPPESFGMVLVEAMACGRPVLAHDIPGVRSVVSDGEDGLLARSGDVSDLVAKIQTLLHDPERRRQMGQHGRAKVERRFAWPRIIPWLVQVYEDVLANRSGERSRI